MFSGIIEEISPLLQVEPGDHSLRFVVQRPQAFDDLKPGDSIAVNGVCLTVEKLGNFNNKPSINFVLGAETLKVLEMTTFEHRLLEIPLNLERSLRFGDRLHGHFVSGHVDFLAPISYSEAFGDSWILRVRVRPELKKAIWKKGSLAINGVSLTVNRTDADEGLSANEVEVCLIPETIRRTNLTRYKVGELLNIEIDWMSKGLLQMVENSGLKTP